MDDTIISETDTEHETEGESDSEAEASDLNNTIKSVDLNNLHQVLAYLTYKERKRM